MENDEKLKKNCEKNENNFVQVCSIYYTCICI